MELLPIHKNQNFMEDCIEILNKEWPRSNGARLYSLQKSCDSFPVALAFVNESENMVLGFSKISDVQGQENSCLFESVIIREKDRGKGFGRILMKKTEDYAKSLGVKTAYLNTTDKIGFYARLGYSKCDPVISLGANAHRVPPSMLKHFAASIQKKSEGLCNEMGKLKVSEQSNTSSTLSSSSPQVTPPPPPPPPPQQGQQQQPLPQVSSCPKTPNGQPAAPPFQSPPPPPPPPPPPMLLSTLSSSSPSLCKANTSQVTWMKKEL